MQSDQQKAAMELSRRVMVCYLERQAAIWASQGDTVRCDVCVGLAYRLRCGSDRELRHLRMAVLQASKNPE
jgi:hypothetical protein